MNELITSLSVDISNDPFTGLKRKLVHLRLEIGEDLEMIHHRKIVFYEKLEGDVYGRPIVQAIEEDATLSDDAKRLKLDMLKPQELQVNTIGVKVNAYGNPVLVGADGNYPEGSLGELHFWQNLPLAMIQPPPVSISEAVYALLKMSMKSSDNNGRV